MRRRRGLRDGNPVKREDMTAFREHTDPDSSSGASRSNGRHAPEQVASAARARVADEAADGTAEEPEEQTGGTLTALPARIADQTAAMAGTIRPVVRMKMSVVTSSTTAGGVPCGSRLSSSSGTRVAVARMRKTSSRG